MYKIFSADIIEGFIQALADADYNFHGKPYNDVPHTEADVGGEVHSFILQLLTHHHFV
jgi:hypothetical protein